MIFVDTNVFSELVKPRAEDRVVAWLFERRHETLLSTLVVAELSVGIRTTRGPDKALSPAGRGLGEGMLRWEESV